MNKSLLMRSDVKSLAHRFGVKALIGQRARAEAEHAAALDAAGEIRGEMARRAARRERNKPGSDLKDRAHRARDESTPNDHGWGEQHLHDYSSMQPPRTYLGKKDIGELDTKAAKKGGRKPKTREDGGPIPKDRPHSLQTQYTDEQWAALPANTRRGYSVSERSRRGHRDIAREREKVRAGIAMGREPAGPQDSTSAFRSADPTYSRLKPVPQSNEFPEHQPEYGYAPPSSGRSTPAARVSRMADDTMIPPSAYGGSSGSPEYGYAPVSAYRSEPAARVTHMEDGSRIHPGAYAEQDAADEAGYARQRQERMNVQSWGPISREPAAWAREVSGQATNVRRGASRGLPVFGPRYGGGKSMSLSKDQDRANSFLKRLKLEN